MRAKEMRDFGVFGVISSLLILVVFVVLHVLDVPAGQFLDWVVGLASFWWLLAIVTIPWTLYFQAREVVFQAKESRQAGIPVDRERVRWVSRVAWRMLWLAMVLHGGSALVFGALAYTGVTPVGYVCGGLALLLTVLRPGWRVLEYVQQRLKQLNAEFHVPREDALALRRGLEQVAQKLREVEREVAQSGRQLAMVERVHEGLVEAFEVLGNQNAQEHERLAARTDEAVRKLSEDAQFLEHVRELIRFVRSA